VELILLTLAMPYLSCLFGQSTCGPQNERQICKIGWWDWSEVSSDSSENKHNDIEFDLWLWLTHAAMISAENQSHLLHKLKVEFPLTDKEQQVLMRGRNAVTRSKNRRNPSAYQDSTAFEALIGYTFITCPERCRDLLAWLEKKVDGY
jgi:hypothetical protein